MAGESPAKHKYVRLDSYVPNKEIVSRKYTQFDEVSEETAIRYLKELEEKYAPGSIIADVPSNKTGVNGGVFKKNKGNILGGQMILEVPVQKKGIPRRILEYAEDRDIQIRDTNGKIYDLRNESDVQILEYKLQETSERRSHAVSLGQLQQDSLLSSQEERGSIGACFSRSA